MPDLSAGKLPARSRFGPQLESARDPQSYPVLPTVSFMEALEPEIERYCCWLSNAQGSEWEDAYPNWPALYSATESALNRGGFTDEQTEAILYVLAQDHEAERVRGYLAKRPTVGIQVGRAALEYPSRDARWQCADLLGEIGTSEALDLVEQFLQDDHEYVRRRALLALRERHPETAESVARSWLDAEHEYSRMVALDTLHVLDADDFAEAKERMRADESEVVQKRIAEIERGE